MPRSTPSPQSLRRRARALLLFALAAAALASHAATALAQSCSAPSFAEPPVYPVGRDTRSIAAADFDGDGRPDLVAAHVDSDSVTVLRKVARGVPAAADSYGVGRFPVDVVAADFNGDGRPDIVTANNSSSNVTVLLNDGGGRFVPGGTFVAGGSPRALAAADFNGDGRLDLAVAGSGLFSALVLHGNGQGGFGAPGGVFSGPEATNVIAADFNGDARPDLALSTHDGVRIAHSLGNGTFNVMPGGCAQAPVLDGLAAGDVNGDGRTDLAATNILGRTTSLLLGDGTGCFGPAAVLPETARHASMADLNGDRRLDLVEGTGVRLGNGAGGFGPLKVHGTSSHGPEPEANTVVADFDGDGRPDLASAGFGTLGVLLGDGAGGFKSSVGPAGRGAYGGDRGDLNGDGRLDLVLVTDGGVTVMLGDGAGGFGPPASFNVSPYAYAATIADFNRDGKPDVATVDSQNPPDAPSRLHVLLGDGAGRLGAPILTNFSGNEPSGLVVGDFNGDARPDLVVLNRRGGLNHDGTINVALGNGAGRFTVADPVPVPVATNPKSAAAGDFNGDGKLDLAVPGDGFSILLGDGAGKFGAPIRNLSANATGLGAADFNGDGRLDLAFVGFQNHVHVALGDGRGGFGAPASYEVGTFTEDITVADFNRDGKPDVAAAHHKPSPVSPTSTLAAVSVLFGDGAGRLGPAAAYFVDRTPWRVLSGDFNGDGLPEVVTANAVVNNLSVLLNTCGGGGGGGQTPGVRLGASSYSADEGAGGLTVTVVRTGSIAGPASVRYATSDVTASSRSDYIAAFGTLSFAAGEGTKSFKILIVDDARAGEGNESLNVTLSGAVGATLGAPSAAAVSIRENDPTVTRDNPVDDALFFVRQHYLDFLNREPDAAGLNFWASQITECEARPEAERAACRDLKRQNVSAAFFLSIEFQETGYLVYRVYKAAFGDAASPGVPGTVPVVRLNEFLGDTQQIGQGVAVGVGNWQAQLEANKSEYARDFVQRARFAAAFPATLTPAQFVDRLDQNAGSILTQAEREQLAAQLASAPDASAGRAAVLRQVAEKQLLRDRELNRAFVLMQYFGYLRRNPNDAPDSNFGGWRFWLNKLEDNGGNFVRAEMVKAFIVSIEYRERFN